jgi:hypothetical protein
MGSEAMGSSEALGARMDGLEARLQEIEDERAIRDLVNRYGYNADGQRDDRWVDLWTEDGVYDLLSTVNYPDGSTRVLERSWAGKDELRALITDPLGHQRSGFYGHSMHTGGSSMVVHVDGDRALANSYSFLYQEHDGTVDLVSAADNQWTLVRVGGEWLIRERRRRQVGTTAFIENLDATPA